jgi:hypothetical protein
VVILLFHSALRFIHWNFVRFSISCAHVVGVLRFFSLISNSLLHIVVCWKHYHLWDYCCDADYLFPPLSEGAGPALSWEHVDSPTVTLGSTRLICTVRSRSPGIHILAGYSFPPISGQSGILSLYRRGGGGSSPVFEHSSEHWVSIQCRRHTS